MQVCGVLRTYVGTCVIGDAFGEYGFAADHLHSAIASASLKTSVVWIPVLSMSTERHAGSPMELRWRGSGSEKVLHRLVRKV